jgi:cytochrome bd-type quinol oxidase subunit 2
LSERVLFGLIIILGYFAVGGVMMILNHFGTLDDKTYALAHDMHLTVGPLMGIMVQSMYKTDKTDRLNAQTQATLADRLPAAPTTVTIAADSENPVPVQEVPVAAKPVHPLARPTQ